MCFYRRKPSRRLQLPFIRHQQRGNIPPLRDGVIVHSDCRSIHHIVASAVIGNHLTGGWLMSQNEYEMLLDLVKRRRTVRQFKPDPLPDGCIEKIIDVARWAPSGFHTQPWEFVVVKDWDHEYSIL